MPSPADCLPRTSNPAAGLGRSARWNAFVVTVLALVGGLVVLAIGAKTLHYSRQSAETRYFSSSVKITKFSDGKLQSSLGVLVRPVALEVEPPDEARRLETNRSRAQAVSGRVQLRRLRSPPVPA